MPKPEDVIVLIDSNALIHRAFHAFPQTLTTRKGELVNAVYGFARLLLQVLADFHPEYTVCVFDTRKPTFRHEMFADYKGTRAKTDEALIPQFDRVRELVKALNIPILMVDGFEADDLIGSIAKGSTSNGISKIIVSGDKDLFQLLDNETQIYMAAGSFSQSVLYDIPKAAKKLGFDPKFTADYKGLCGDNSDNIPGVKGIGEKTAAELINKFGYLEDIYQHLDELKPAVKNKLETNQETAFFSKKLATIITDVKLDFTLQDARLADYDYDKAVDFFQSLEFRSLISKLPKTAQHKSDTVVKNDQLDFLSQPQQSSKTGPVATPAELSKFIGQLSKEDYLVVRTYTNEPKNLLAPIESLVVVSKNQQAVISKTALQGEALTELSKLLQSKPLVTHEGKKDLHALISSGVEVSEIAFDTMIAAFLLYCGSGKFDLVSLAFNTFGLDLSSAPPTSPENMLQEGMIIRQLYQELGPKLEAMNQSNAYGWNMNRLFAEIELPIISVLLGMEQKGIILDIKYLQGFAKELTKQIATLQAEIFKEVGHEFNIASPKQLGQILFEEMHLPYGKKTKNGSYSTNEKVLAHLADNFPIIQKLFSFRELSKLKSTYTQALIDQVNKSTGRIHTNYRQAIAATGRLSSTDPNLQNIPISTDVGKKIRQAFIAPEKHMFVSFDYSQQELRLLAQFSGEAKLYEAFNNHIDIHALTASQIFHKDVKEIDSHERRIGKTVNFGVVYGMSSFGLADRLRISREDAQLFIDTFFASYPKVREYFDKLLIQAKTQGYVETLMGRRKNTTAMATANFQARAAIEREVVNFPLQGSAADMMKYSMIKSAEKIKENYSDFGQLTLQIHDELVFEVTADSTKNARLGKFIHDIKEIMLHVVDLDVDMDVNVEVGTDLANLEEI